MPLVLLRTIANRQLVVACCAKAAQAGIRPEMTMAQARALCAQVEGIDWRPDLDQKACEALARYLNRFTPTVALETRDIADSESQISNLRFQIFLDLTGCEHLFGGLSNMVHRIGQSLHKLRIPSILGVANTPAAAYAMTCVPLASTGPLQRVRMIIPDDLAQPPVDSLPLHALRLPDEILQTLHHLGLETIGQLRKLSRESLPSRFGPILLRRLDQLDGRLPEPLVSLAWTTPMVVRFDFDGSVADPQALELTCRDLLEKLLLELDRKGKGIRELRITLERVDAPAEQFTISASRPSRNLRSLMGLYRCAFDQLGISSLKSPISKRNYSRNYDVGFTAMVLEVTRSQTLAHQQVTLGDSDRMQYDDAWQNTLDLIRTRLGEASIAQVQLEHSYLPEKAFKRTAASTPEKEAFDAELSGSRPLVLQSPPIELRVMVAPSHDADGAPLSFNFQGTLHTVKYAFGPERIAGQWWEGHNKTRDYFDVADEAGRRYWMFRVQETGKWFLHGRFE